MNRIKTAIREAHRRSLWQVLGVYLAVSWGVYQVVKELTELFGLPDWVPGFGIVLLLIGLPIVLATAFVQEGAPGRRVEPDPIDPTLMPMLEEPVAPTPPPRAHSVFTWQKAVLGGIVAFLLLGVTAGGYMGLRNAGVGPFASLMSSGELDAREPILIAEFAALNGDTMLARTITEAFRVDFTQTNSVTVAQPKHVRTVLQRMSRDPDSHVDADLAHEIAVRDNIKTYLVGEVSQAGSKYVVAAKLLATRDGRVLASYRETAPNADEIITAVDQLSKKMRNKIGESLKTIRAEKPLELVSTPSLEALQKYTQATYAIDVETDFDKGISLLQEAIQLDTGFAMAWRKLAVAYNNSGRSEELRAPAILKAYQLRDRLTDVERYSAMGMYYYSLKEDFQKAASAYEMLADRDPTWPPNNLGIVYMNLRDFPRAVETFKRTIQVDSTLVQGYQNLIDAQLEMGDVKAARATLAAYRSRFPPHPAMRGFELWILAHQQDYAKADLLMKHDPEIERIPLWRARANYVRGDLARLRGRVAEGDRLRAIAVAADVERGNAFAPLQNDLQRVFFAWIAERDPAKARKILDATVTQHRITDLPALDRPYLDLAEAYSLFGDRARVDYYVQQYEQNVPVELRGNEQPKRDLIAGSLAFFEKRHAEAISNFRKRAAARTCRICAITPLALAFEQAGMPDSAIVYYRYYLETPDSERLWPDTYELAPTFERLADLYAARGDNANAARFAGKFVELWKNADPHLQPRVQAKREMLRQLGRT